MYLSFLSPVRTKKFGYSQYIPRPGLAGTGYFFAAPLGFYTCLYVNTIIKLYPKPIAPILGL